MNGLVRLALAAVEGFFRGLVLWMLIGVAVSYTFILLDGEISADSINETLVSFTHGALSLLVSFLVANNINTALAVTTTISDIEGACIELACLSHSLFTSKKTDLDRCVFQSVKLENIAVMVIEAVLTDGKSLNGKSIHFILLDGFKGVTNAKIQGSLEPPIVGIFYQALSKIASKYNTLDSLRKNGTPPAIRGTVYIMGIITVAQYVLLMQGDATTTRLTVGAFVSAGTLGVLDVSAVCSDPLNSIFISGTLHQSLKETKELVRGFGKACKAPIQTIFATARPPDEEFNWLLPAPALKYHTRP